MVLENHIILGVSKQYKQLFLVFAKNVWKNILKNTLKHDDHLQGPTKVIIYLVQKVSF